MNRLIGEMLRFGIVGVCNTVLGLVLSMTFYNVFHWNYWVSTITSYTIGSFFSYFMNKKLTFRVKENNKKYVIRFTLNIMACFLLAYGMAKPLVRNLLNGYDTVIVENVAMIVGMGIFIVINFLGQKLLVFKDNGERA